MLDFDAVDDDGGADAKDMEDVGAKRMICG